MQMNDNDYRCIMRYKAENDSLIIESCTPAMKELFNITAEVDGRLLGKQLPAPLCRWVYNAVHYLINGNRSILAFKECGGCFAAVKISYEEPLLSVYAHPFSDRAFFDKLRHSSNLCLLSAERFFGSFKFSIILARQEEHFIIERIDEKAAEAFSVTQGDIFDPVINNFCMVESDRVLHYSLDNHKFLYCTDVYYDNGSISHYIIGIIPSSSDRITLTFHSLDSHEYYRLVSSCMTDNDIHVSEINAGIAAFKMSAGKAPFLEKHNSSYDMLTCNNSDSYYVLNSLIHKSHLTSSVVSVPHRFGETDCIAAAIPFPKNDQVFVFIFPVAATTASPTVINQKLTMREFEIASLISSGKSNSEIASVCGISLGTVKKTISNIYSKLGIHSRSELVRLVFLHSDRPGQI